MLTSRFGMRNHTYYFHYSAGSRILPIRSIFFPAGGKDQECIPMRQAETSTRECLPTMLDFGKILILNIILSKE
jgi:hypothetical protein